MIIYFHFLQILISLLLFDVNECISIDNQYQIRQFNIAINHPVGSYIGSIVSNENILTMQPPFYLVPIIPEDSSLLEKYLSVDLDTGKISLNNQLPPNITIIKFSALSINEGTALTILINIAKNEPKTTTAIMTTTKTECFYMDLMETNFVDNSNYNCYSVNTKKENYLVNDQNCNLSQDLKELDLEWNGILVPVCDMSKKRISLMLIDRSNVQKFTTTSIFDLFSYPYIVDAKNVENIDEIKLLKQIELDIRCNSKNIKFSKIMKLYINDDDNDLYKMDFVLMRASHEYLIKNQLNILDYLANNFKNFNNQNKSNFLILTKFKQEFSVIDKCKEMIVDTTSTTSTSTTKTTTSTIQTIKTTTPTSTTISSTTSTIKSTTTTTATTTLSSVITYSVVILPENVSNVLVDSTSTEENSVKKTNDKITKSSKFSLKLFLLALVITISSLLAILYITFILFRKSYGVRSTMSSSSIGTTNTIMVHSKKFSSNSFSDNDNLVSEVKSNNYLGKILGFMTLPTSCQMGSKLNGSFSVNTILTRASTSSSNENNNNINNNNRDYYSTKSSSKHSMMSSLNRNHNNSNNLDYNLESLTGLKVNEILVQDQELVIRDHQEINLPLQSNDLLAYSDNYLNQMGINMMDNIKDLAVSNPNFHANSLQQYEQEVVSSSNNINNNQEFYRWCSLLDWKFEFSSIKDVLDDLAQLK